MTRQWACGIQTPFCRTAIHLGDDRTRGCAWCQPWRYDGLQGAFSWWGSVSSHTSSWAEPDRNTTLGFMLAPHRRTKADDVTRWLKPRLDIHLWCFCHLASGSCERTLLSEVKECEKVPSSAFFKRQKLFLKSVSVAGFKRQAFSWEHLRCPAAQGQRRTAVLLKRLYLWTSFYSLQAGRRAERH